MGNLCSIYSRVSLSYLGTRAVARRARRPSHVWKSWNIISTFPQTRNKNPTKPRWTLHMLDYYNNSSYFCNYRSWANSNSSTTTTRPSFLHLSSKFCVSVICVSGSVVFLIYCFANRWIQTIWHRSSFAFQASQEVFCQPLL